MKLENLVKAQQLSKELLLELFKTANEMRSNPSNFSDNLKGKIMATLFYEPSTRTRLSFESAMMHLGGEVISTENAGEFSSAVKGESLEDTIRTAAAYSDVVVLRHKEVNSSERVAKLIKIPIINAGDGSGQHPTQALLDVYTIYREFNRLDNLNVALVGDLANGRTARSLSYLLSKFDDIKISFVSPENLKMGDDIKSHLDENEVAYQERDNLNEILPDLDIIYMTRIQKERMGIEDYEKAKGKYVIDETNLDLIKENARILHPLPHVEEIQLPISVEESDQRVAYFRQVENGLYARMALLNYLLEN